MLVGCIDQVGSAISGWCVDTDDPTKPAEVKIFADGNLHGIALANEPRPDLQSLNFGHDRLGFSVPGPLTTSYRLPIVYGKVGDQVIIPTPSARSYGFPVFLAHPFLPDALNSIFRLEHKPGIQPPSDAFMGRLVAALSGGNEREEGAGPLWGAISSQRHSEVAMMIAEHRTQELAAYLARLGETDLAWGFFGGPDSHGLNRDNDHFNSVEALYVFDRLISLSEYLGTIVVENPEQGSWNQIANLTVEDLLSRIAAKLKIDLSPPEIGGYWGFTTSHGHINARIVDALYAAVRVVRALRQCGGSSVIEIGGGAGLVAHYALKLGVDRYKIVDLPLVGLAQAFVLHNQPGLVLHGEARDGNLKIVPPESYLEETSEKYDLLFNMDSLPEIESNAAFDYLTNAGKHGLRSFLSINQESHAETAGWKQNIVFELAERAKFEQLSRNRSWMRVGYVEELYQVT